MLNNKGFALQRKLRTGISRPPASALMSSSPGYNMASETDNDCAITRIPQKQAECIFLVVVQCYGLHIMDMHNIFQLVSVLRKQQRMQGDQIQAMAQDSLECWKPHH